MGRLAGVRRLLPSSGAGPVKKGAGEFAGGGGVESEAARGEQGALILACDGLSGDEADVGVGFHDADKVGSGDGFDRAGGEGLGH